MEKDLVKRDSFVFYKNYFEVLKEFEPKDQVTLIKAIVEYAINGKEPILKVTLKGVFQVIKSTLGSSKKDTKMDVKVANTGSLEVDLKTKRVTDSRINDPRESKSVDKQEKNETENLTGTT